MGLIVKENGNGGFEPLPEGVHIAVCYGLIDLGEQYSANFDTYANKVLVLWQIPSETYEADGEQKPRTISKEYTMSLNSKAVLRKHLEAWRGKSFTDEELEGFNLTNIIGVGCQLQIIHKTSGNGKPYANISAIMALPKGMKIDYPAETAIFDMDEENCWAQLIGLPEWIVTKVHESTEYKTWVTDQELPFKEDEDLESELNF